MYEELKYRNTTTSTEVMNYFDYPVDILSDEIADEERD